VKVVQPVQIGFESGDGYFSHRNAAFDGQRNMPLEAVATEVRRDDIGWSQ
jgi:hypothetical protein